MYSAPCQLITALFQPDLLVSVKTAFIVAGKIRCIRNGIVRRVKIDKTAIADFAKRFCKILIAKCDTAGRKILIHSSQNRFIDDVRIFVIAKRRIELTRRINSKQTVKTGFVQINQPRGTFNF